MLNGSCFIAISLSTSRRQDLEAADWVGGLAAATPFKPLGDAAGRRTADPYLSSLPGDCLLARRILGLGKWGDERSKERKGV